MNGVRITLYVNALYSQHLLNKLLTNMESDKRLPFLPQHYFSIVEYLLRVYVVYLQYGYIPIQQFNKKRKRLQRFKLFPCDGIETPDPLYRLIPTLPIVIELIGGIGQSVGCRGKFPALLQYFPYLVLLHFYLRVYQQKKNIVITEREGVRAYALHDVKYKFVHLYLQPITVAADNDLETVLLQYSAFLCVTSFFPLAPVGFINAFILSHSAHFRAFYAVIPDILPIFATR